MHQQSNSIYKINCSFLLIVDALAKNVLDFPSTVTKAVDLALNLADWKYAEKKCRETAERM